MCILIYTRIYKKYNNELITKLNICQAVEITFSDFLPTENNAYAK